MPSSVYPIYSSIKHSLLGLIFPHFYTYQNYCIYLSWIMYHIISLISKALYRQKTNTKILSSTYSIRYLCSFLSAFCFFAKIICYTSYTNKIHIISYHIIMLIYVYIFSFICFFFYFCFIIRNMLTLLCLCVWVCKKDRERSHNV